MQQDLGKKWRTYAQRVLKREMGHSLVKPSELAEKLGISADSLRIKIRRAGFTAGFFLQALDALDVKKIDLEEIKRLENNNKTKHET
jgi:hypothetical protein